MTRTASILLVDDREENLTALRAILERDDYRLLVATSGEDALKIALRDLEPRIEMDEDIRLAARKSLDRMLDMASGTVGKGDLGKR